MLLTISHFEGLCQAYCGWYLELPFMQKGYCWRRLDSVDHRRGDSPKVSLVLSFNANTYPPIFQIPFEYKFITIYFWYLRAKLITLHSSTIRRLRDLNEA
jgi:hypothetical protein